MKYIAGNVNPNKIYMDFLKVYVKWNTDLVLSFNTY